MKLRVFALALAIIFGASVPSSGQEAAEARAVIEKAIQARGLKLDSPEMSESWKDTGKLTFMGQAMPYVAVWTFQPPDKFHFSMEMKFNGQDMKVLAAIDGGQAWESAMNTTRPVEGKKLEVMKHEAYLLWLTSLQPLLKAKEFKLSPLPESQVDGKPMLGVKVSREGHRDVSLFFDRETGLLRKSESSTLDEFQDWKEVKEEAVFSDYAEVDGVKYFRKLRVIRDGKPLLESDLSEQKRLQKVDPKQFAKPAGA